MSPVNSWRVTTQADKEQRLARRIKDVRAGGLSATADRLHIGPIDRIELVFDGFRPVSLTASLHRVTATNLALVLGGQ